MWRSPVAHLNGVQGVAGSNPVIPIDDKRAGFHRGNLPREDPAFLCDLPLAKRDQWWVSGVSL